MLELGRSNDKFVHIKKGVNVDDMVVVNPMAILDEEEEAVEAEISPDAGVPEAPEIDADTIAAVKKEGEASSKAKSRGSRSKQGQRSGARGGGKRPQTAGPSRSRRSGKSPSASSEQVGDGD